MARFTQHDSSTLLLAFIKERARASHAPVVRVRGRGVREGEREGWVEGGRGGREGREFVWWKREGEKERMEGRKGR